MAAGTNIAIIHVYTGYLLHYNYTVMLLVTFT
jgi:hypothetical protein